MIVIGAWEGVTSPAPSDPVELVLSISAPEMEPENTNPVGSFEASWVSELHMHCPHKAEIRRWTGDLAAAVTQRPKPSREFPGLSELCSNPQVVMEGPRAFWFSDLGLETVERAVTRLGRLSMMR